MFRTSRRSVNWYVVWERRIFTSIAFVSLRGSTNRVVLSLRTDCRREDGLNVTVAPYCLLRPRPRIDHETDFVTRAEASREQDLGVRVDSSREPVLRLVAVDFAIPFHQAVEVRAEGDVLGKFDVEGAADVRVLQHVGGEVEIPG